MTLKTIALAYVGALVLAFYIGSGGAKASSSDSEAGNGVASIVTGNEDTGFF